MSAASKFDASTDALARSMEGHPVIRAVNFHSTPRSRVGEYREQLAGLSRAFSPVTEADLDRYLATGEWNHSKPGVIIAVYEGYRNGFDVMRPLLEEFGLVGWFFIITDFLKASVEGGGQVRFAKAHDIGMATQEYADGRVALSWGELRAIDRHHVIGSHARKHVWVASLDPQEKESEILGSQRDLKEVLGHPVRSFVSYGGPAFGTDATMDALIRSAGYQFVFSNHKIQRLRD